MPIPLYVQQMRAKIGHDLLFQPAVSAIIFNDAGHVLLQRRSDNGQWSIPGGMIEPGEDVADAVIREVYEETSLTVTPERIIGVWGGADHLITYPNGDQTAIISTTFLCRIVSGEPRINDDESLELCFFPTDALPTLDPRILERVEQALRNEPHAYFRPAR